MRSPWLVLIAILGSAPVPTLVPGCGGVTSTASPPGGSSPDGGSPSAVGTQPSTGAAGPSSGAAVAGGGCPAMPPIHQAGGTIITFQTDPYLGGKPMVYGQPNVLPGGGTLTPLDLRYFLSNVTLVGSDGSLVPVDLVTPAGKLEGYGIHFFNAEDPATTAWSIRAPAGSFRGMTLTLGITDACNSINVIGDAYWTDSQMSWPPPFGYLFLRYEGQIDGLAPDGGASVDAGANGGVGPLNALTAIAMGGLTGSVFAPAVHIDASLAVPVSGPVMRHLRFVMDQVFAGATANVDVSVGPPPVAGDTSFGPPLTTPGFVSSNDETVAGERLRQTAPKLPIFVLDP